MAKAKRIDHGTTSRNTPDDVMMGKFIKDSVRSALVPGKTYLVKDIGEGDQKRTVSMKLEGLYRDYALLRTSQGIPHTFTYFELADRLVRKGKTDPDSVPSLV